MFRFLEHKWTANIVGIVTALAAIAAVIVSLLMWYSQTTGAAGAKTNTGAHWAGADISWLIIIGVLILSNIGCFIFSRVRRNEIRGLEIIRKLSALQESYILTPQYVSATQHGDHSQERNLSRGGTANILTNSLKYDMFYAGSIAENIIRGAKYVYILPNTHSMIADLRNYITIICDNIQIELSRQGVDATLARVEELCSRNLEFWIFNNENPCLYNFAIFRQTASRGLQPYVQYWWYINPTDTKPDSHMLAFEIQAVRDKSDLDEIFEKLKGGASKTGGLEVFYNRDNLGEWIGGKR